MRFAYLVVLVLGTLLIAPTTRSQEESNLTQLVGIPVAGRFDYEVIRESDRIGTHSVIFRRESRHLTIVTHTDIAVRVLDLTLYRFQYEAEEDWIDGRLTRLTSRTDNDGESLAVDLALSGGRLRGTCNGITLDLPANLLPVTVWHPDIVRQSVLLDQYKCVEQRVRTTDLGFERIVADGRRLTARHYTMTGQLNRDIWYDADGQIVQVRLPAMDGSEITFVRLMSSELPMVTQRRALASPVRHTLPVGRKNPRPADHAASW